MKLTGYTLNMHVFIVSVRSYTLWALVRIHSEAVKGVPQIYVISENKEDMFDVFFSTSYIL